MRTFLWIVVLAIGAGPQEDEKDPKNAESLLKGALAQAKEGKKRVFLTFGAPG